MELGNLVRLETERLIEKFSVLKVLKKRFLRRMQRRVNSNNNKASKLKSMN